jgi:hypothetical protein
MNYEARVRFEKETVSLMIGMYCQAVHKSSSLCTNCRKVQEYAFARIEKCSLHPSKPVCSVCPVHCYKPGMRQQIREIMRFSGPRMPGKYPLKALSYLWLKYIVSRKTYPVRSIRRS